MGVSSKREQWKGTGDAPACCARHCRRRSPPHCKQTGTWAQCGSRSAAAARCSLRPTPSRCGCVRRGRRRRDLPLQPLPAQTPQPGGVKGICVQASVVDAKVAAECWLKAPAQQLCARTRSCVFSRRVHIGLKSARMHTAKSTSLGAPEESTRASSSATLSSGSRRRLRVVEWVACVKPPLRR